MSLINHKIKNTYPMLHNKNCIRIYNVAKSKLCNNNKLCSKMSLFTNVFFTFGVNLWAEADRAT